MSEMSLTSKSTLTMDDPVYQLNPAAKPFIPNYAIVVFERGPQAGQVIGLNMGMNLFGRIEGNILQDVLASRQHAQIYFNGSAYVLEDLGSTNGTFVNDELINREFILKHGDMIRIGETILAFEILGEKDSRLSRTAPPDKKITSPSDLPTMSTDDLSASQEMDEKPETLHLS